jgi:hypothetical protein
MRASTARVVADVLSSSEEAPLLIASAIGPLNGRRTLVCVISSLQWQRYACLHQAQKHELIIIIVIIIVIIATVRMDTLTQAGLLRGAAGTCAGKWAVTRGLSTIEPSLGLTTASTQVGLRSGRSSYGATTSARLSDKRMGIGSYGAAMTVMPCEPVRDPWQALSPSGEPTPPCSRRLPLSSAV